MPSLAVRVSAGGAVQVVVLSEWRVVLQVLPLCAVVLWGGVAGLAAFGARGSPLSLRSLRVVGEARPLTARVGDPVPWPCLRCAVASSSGGAGPVG